MIHVHLACHVIASNDISQQMNYFECQVTISMKYLLVHKIQGLFHPIFTISIIDLHVHFILNKKNQLLHHNI